MSADKVKPEKEELDPLVMTAAIILVFTVIAIISALLLVTHKKAQQTTAPQTDGKQPRQA